MNLSVPFNSQQQVYNHLNELAVRESQCCKKNLNILVSKTHILPRWKEWNGGSLLIFPQLWVLNCLLCVHHGIASHHISVLLLSPPIWTDKVKLSDYHMNEMMEGALHNLKCKLCQRGLTWRSLLGYLWA